MCRSKFSRDWPGNINIYIIYAGLLIFVLFTVLMIIWNATPATSATNPYRDSSFLELSSNLWSIWLQSWLPLRRTWIQMQLVDVNGRGIIYWFPETATITPDIGGLQQLSGLAMCNHFHLSTAPGECGPLRCGLSLCTANSHVHGFIDGLIYWPVRHSLWAYRVSLACRIFGVTFLSCLYLSTSRHPS